MILTSFRYSPTAWRYISSGNRERGFGMWGIGTQTTEHLKGYFIYDLGELHWKPKTKKFDQYFRYNKDMSKEDWFKRLQELNTELEELHSKCKNWWINILRPTNP